MRLGIAVWFLRGGLVEFLTTCDDALAGARIASAVSSAFDVRAFVASLADSRERAPLDRHRCDAVLPTSLTAQYDAAVTRWSNARLSNSPEATAASVEMLRLRAALLAARQAA